nr:MAG TPA: hypothetical protein [Caudoviricetes sp.]
MSFFTRVDGMKWEYQRKKSIQMHSKSPFF